MKIKSIDVIPFQPYFTEPFKQFGVTQTQLKHEILRIEDSLGRVGYGEAVLSPVLSRNVTRDHDLIASLLGTPLAKLSATIAETRRKGSEYYAVTFALDTALHDLIARNTGMPLHALLGGKQSESIKDFATVPLCDVEETIARFEKLKSREVIQMKLGEQGIALDEARIDAALKVMGKDQLFLADFNGAHSLADATAILSNFNDKRIVWEEPCPTIEDNEALVEKLGVPLLADQCITVARAPQVCTKGLFYGVTIKPAKTGSLAAACAVRDTYVEAGVRVRIDGPWCGPIAATAILSIAVGTPPELLVATSDMTDPLALKAEERLGFVFDEKGRIAPTDRPGIGFLPNLFYLE